ncbi:major intrinsic protein superfamily membrane channel protein [Lentinula lateritia]|nr:major intrinsic protein superfamily membrane channel protein [Lentinula lateritia]
MGSSITTNPPSAAYRDKSDDLTSSHHEHHQPYEPVDENNLRSTRLGRYGNFVQPYVAEFAGTMLLVIFGIGANCQVSLSHNQNVSAASKGGYTSVGFGFAVGISLGVWVSASRSGGHINPAVTIALATFRKFPWKMVPGIVHSRRGAMVGSFDTGYIFSQLLGGFIGAALIYANYYHAINIFEGGSGIRTLLTAGNFGTYPLDYMTNVSAFFSEFLGTALLVFIVFAATDPRNAIPSAAIPFVLFTVLLGIALCLGMETGFAVNPARDLGPRLLTSIVGYGGAVYSFRHQYWLWGGILAPILGGVTGACFYDLLFIDSGRFRNVLDRKEAAVRNGNGKSSV